MFDPVLTWLLCMGPASWTSDASLVPGVIASSFCTTSAFLLERHVRIAAGGLQSINGVTVALLAVLLAWLGTCALSLFLYCGERQKFGTQILFRSIGKSYVTLSAFSTGSRSFL